MLSTNVECEAKWWSRVDATTDGLTADSIPMF
jgi:hypothetical protein